MESSTRMFVKYNCVDNACEQQGSWKSGQLVFENKERKNVIHFPQSSTTFLLEVHEASNTFKSNVATRK
jgi:hypothetical protein